MASFSPGPILFAFLPLAHSFLCCGIGCLRLQALSFPIFEIRPSDQGDAQSGPWRGREHSYPFLSPCQELIAIQMGMVHTALGKMPKEEPAVQMLVRRVGQ